MTSFEGSVPSFPPTHTNTPSDTVNNDNYLNYFAMSVCGIVSFLKSLSQLNGFIQFISERTKKHLTLDNSNKCNLILYFLRQKNKAWWSLYQQCCGFEGGNIFPCSQKKCKLLNILFNDYNNKLSQ